MSNPNPLNRDTLRELADVLERRRVPMLVERWRRQQHDTGQPVLAWRMRRQVREAFRDEWRRRMDRKPAKRAGKGQDQALTTKAVVAAYRQLDRELEAALLAASPDAMPKIASDVIRRHVGR
jgi:hypothetical protein